MLLLLTALVAAGHPFPCTVVGVHDGDGPFHCASGVSIRLAGVQAPDFTNTVPCRQRRAAFVCSDRLATRSRDRMTALIQGRTLACRSSGQSYTRTVATCTLDGADLSCLAMARGIATRWARYDPSGALLRCEPHVGFGDFIARVIGKQRLERPDEHPG